MVHVTETYAVDETAPSLTIHLLSESLGNILVTDENRNLVPYEIVRGQMILQTLGASRITLEYDTSALTKKDGNVWTIKIPAQSNLTLILPRESTVLYLSDVPIASTVRDGTPLLTLGPSKWEISYVTPLPHAPEQNAAAIPYEYYLLAAGIAVASSLLLIKRRMRPVEEEDELDYQLRPEDKQVLEYLAERGGKVLEVELREKFFLPKTTAWRMVRRLERLGRIRVRKMGGLNEIELVDRA